MSNQLANTLPLIKLLLLSLLLIILLTSSFTYSLDVEESSGSDELWLQLPRPKVEDASFIKSVLMDPLFKGNVSVKLHLTRVDENLANQRIELTFWLEEVYVNLLKDDNVIDHKKPFSGKLNLNDLKMDKMKFDSIKSDKIKFIVEEKTFPISSLAVKNAIFMKIHRTPSLNSFITIEDKVNVAIHTKMSVDVPCVHLSASHSFANPVQLICANVMYELPSYATGKRIEDSAVCQMEIGSYLFDTAKLNLNWDQVPIVGESLPCSNENWPKCLIEQIHTIKHKTHLFDDEHNDLVACFLLNIRRVYRNT